MTNQRNFDITYMQIDCVHRYSTKYKISMRETSILFDKYNIWGYISTCYDILHLEGTDYIVKDIAKRIKEGVKYVERYTR